jgi:hypothetical protein
MYPLSYLKNLRRFSTIVGTKNPRAFLVITREPSLTDQMLLAFYKAGTKIETTSDYNEDFSIYTEKKGESKLNSNLCFTKDKSFIKYLTWINLESKDKENISIARLIAYNIHNNLKMIDLKNDDVIRGIVKGLEVLQNNFTHFSKSINEDPDIKIKACNTYSQGVANISHILQFMHLGKENKKMLVTKELGGTGHVGRVDVQNSIRINSGHASYSYINDKLNYRVDLLSPIIIMSEDLSISEIEEGFKIAAELNKNLVFVTKTSQVLPDDFQNYKNKSFQKDFGLVNLSENPEECDETYTFLLEQLKNDDDVNSNLI